MTQQITHPLSRSSLQTRRREQVQLQQLVQRRFRHTHTEKIERKVTNLVAKMTKSAA